MTNLFLIVGYWALSDLVCPNCARKVDLQSLRPIGGDDEELIAHDSCVGCGAIYFGQGLWQQPKLKPKN